MQWSGGTRDDRLELIATCYEDGFSASQLASAISDKVGHFVSRNAVIGMYCRNPPLKKLHPLLDPPAVSRRGHEAASRAVKAARAAMPVPQKMIRVPKEKPAPVVSETIRPPSSCELAVTRFDEARRLEAVPLTSLGRHQCKWPIDMPRDGQFFCAAETDGSPYCTHHRARSVASKVAA